jgi:hypothetical protein
VSLSSKRLSVTGGSSSVSAQLEALNSQRNTVLSELGSLKETVYAPSAGYYYHDVDGYEGVFDAALVDTMTYADAVSMVSAPSADTRGNCGKMVTEYKWYIMFFTDDAYSEGDTLSVTFTANKNTTLEMEVERVIGGEGQPDAVIASTERVPTDFTFTRSQHAKLLKTTYTGFSVPVSAVRIVDGVKGVYVLTGSTVHFRKISIIAEYEDSYIVDTDPDGTLNDTEDTEETSSEDTEGYSWLGLNENVITEGKGMYDGRIIAD